MDFHVIHNPIEFFNNEQNIWKIIYREFCDIVILKKHSLFL